MTATDIDRFGRPVAAPARASYEHDALRRAWAEPRGLGWFASVSSQALGQRTMVVAFLFFLAGGIMALLMRTQLAVPENDFLSYYAYNRLFTMHGTTMMFLFAVPFLEGIALFLAPMMNGARTLALPRLGAFAFWTYVFGALMLYASFAVGQIPDAGWTNYVPLSGPEYSPGKRIDFWLVGLTLVELGTLMTALDLAVTILRGRAPGMSLNRMPIFSWYILVTAFMIMFGFPPLIIANILLEVERTFGWPIFEPGRGGEPLLWQQLFWFFGHPEVYIVFLPASGLVSTMIASMSRRRTVTHFLFITAAVGTAFVSFSVWVHHMFTTGIDLPSLALFSGASMTVAVFSGIQVFAWLATLWLGRPILKTPMLFVLGFIWLFVIGGLMGVSHAVIPIDWQTHSTYYLIAHFHFVMVGGAVFPIFGALHYYYPMVSGRMYREWLGKLTFWTMFLGFNLSFMPMLWSGMNGMMRRLAVYPENTWEIPNLLSTIGAFTIGVSVLMYIVNAVWSWRTGVRVSDDPWESGGLEWAVPLPRPIYTWRSIPRIETEYPVWEEKGLVPGMRRGEFFLPEPEQNQRLTMTTTAVGAEPIHITVDPKPTFLPIFAAGALAVAFGSFLLRAWIPAYVFVGLFFVALAFMLWKHPERGLIRPLLAERQLGLPLNSDGGGAHGWWGMLLGVMSHSFGAAALLFSFLYLWNTGGDWPPGGLQYPDPLLPVGAAGALVLGSAAIIVGRLIRTTVLHTASLGLAALFGAAFVAIEVWVLKNLDMQPVEYIYQSVLYIAVAFAIIHVALAVAGMLYAIFWVLTAPTERTERLGFRIAALGWHYIAILGTVTTLIVFLWPSLTRV